jgi:hypothetical protein
MVWVCGSVLRLAKSWRARCEASWSGLHDTVVLLRCGLHMIEFRTPVRLQQRAPTLAACAAQPQRRPVAVPRTPSRACISLTSVGDLLLCGDACCRGGGRRHGRAAAVTRSRRRAHP